MMLESFRDKLGRSQFVFECLEVVRIVGRSGDWFDRRRNLLARLIVGDCRESIICTLITIGIEMDP